MPLCEFAETVLFRIPSPSHDRVKYDSPSVRGLWLGRESTSPEIPLGTSTGVFKARSIRRLPNSEKYDKELFNSFRATPWNRCLDGRFYPQFVLPPSDQVVMIPTKDKGSDEVREETTEPKNVKDPSELQPDLPPDAVRKRETKDESSEEPSRKQQKKE